MSGLLIAMIADTTYPGREKENIDLMIDSGAATHGCPQWFAPRFQLQPLLKGEEPQLRTVTTTQITAHRYKYVNMGSNKQQRHKHVIMRNNKQQPCHPLLRLQRTCTNPASRTMGRTRIQYPTQRTSNNHARVRRTTVTEGRTRFHESRNGAAN